jgi:hypothetical protein
MGYRSSSEQHIEVVYPWLEKHKSSTAKKYSDLGQHRTKAEIIKDHNKFFMHWFKRYLQADPPPMNTAEEKLIFFLSQGSVCNLVT